MKKYIVSAFLAVIVSVCCLVPAHADKITTIAEIIGWGTNPDLVNVGEDELVARRDKVLTVWQPYSSIGSMARAYLSYDALSTLAVDLNSSGYPCYLEFNRNLQLYVIRGTGQVETLGSITILDRYLTNGERGLFCCEYNTDSLLSNISSRFDLLMAENGYLRAFNNSLNSIDSRLDRLMSSPSGYLANINEKLGNAYSTLVSMSATLDKLMSSPSGYLANINEKLGNSYSMLTTIESTLSSINDKLDNLGSSSGSSDNSDVVSAINGISTKMTDLFGLHDTTYEFPSFRDVFANSTGGRVYGVKSSVFNEMPTVDNEGLYYSSYSYLDNPFYNGGTSSGGSYSGHPYTVSVTDSGMWFYQYLETFEMSASEASSLPATVTRNIKGKLIHGVYFTVNNVACPISYADGYATVKCSFFVSGVNGKPQILTSSFKLYDFASNTSLPDLSVQPPASGDCYIYANVPGMAVPVVSPDRFTNFLELQFTRLINAVSSDSGSSVGNSGLIAAITSVGNKITSLFGQYDSTFEFPALDSANSSAVTRLYGVKSTLFGEVPDSENLVYSSSDSIKVQNWEGISSGGEHAGNPASCRPVGPAFYYSEVIPNASAFSSVTVLNRDISFYYYNGSLFSFSGVQCNAIYRDGSLYVTCTIEPRWDEYGKFRNWYSGNFSLTTLAFDPGYRFFSSPPASGDYYIYSLSAATSPVVYSTRFTAFTELQTNRLINAAGASFDASAVVSALGSIDTKITDLFGRYDSTYEFPVVNANSYGLVYGVKSSIFADVPANASLCYSSSSHVIAREWRGTSSGGEYSGNAAKTYCSGARFLYTETVSGVSDPSSIQSVVRNISLNTWDGNLLTFSGVSCLTIPQSSSFYAVAVITPKWDDSGAWLGWYSDSTLLSTDNEPVTKLLSSPPSSGDYYIFSDTADPLPVVYSTRFTSFLQGQFTSVLNAIGSSGGGSSVNLATVESTLSSIDGKLDNLPSSSGSAADLSNIESALSTIIDKMDNLPASVDNIVVNITEDNSAYNIFYVEDENGDKKSVTSVAGDSLSASGKLLQFLYKLIIGSAISDVDNSIDGLNDFFFDEAPSGLGEGVTVWD